MKRYKIRIEEGEELIRILEEKLEKLGIKEAFIVSLAGALSKFALITIDNSSTEIPPGHFETEFNEKAEISGSGFVKNGRAHIHACCGREGGQALCGHLVEGKVTYFVDVGLIAG